MSDHPQNYGSQPTPSSNPGGTPGGYGNSYHNPPSSDGGYGSATSPGVGGYGAGTPQSGGSTYGSPSSSGSTFGSGSSSTFGSGSGSAFSSSSGSTFGPPPGNAGYGTPPTSPGGYGTLPGQEQKTNGFAIASLICGLVAPCGGGLLSVIFGIIALSQIKKNGQKGRGLAIGGMVATAVWILLVALFVVIGILAADGDDDTNQSARSNDRVAEDQHEGSSNGDDNGTDNGGDTTTAPEDIDVLSLSVGDCLSDLSGSMFATLPVVPCSEPHEGEVYALFDVSLDGITYPGEDAIIDEAEQGCDSRLQNYAPSAYRDSGVEIFYLYPSEDTWSFGDREVVCITYYPDGPRTGSIAE